MPVNRKHYAVKLRNKLQVLNANTDGHTQLMSINHTGEENSLLLPKGRFLQKIIVTGEEHPT